MKVIGNYNGNELIKYNSEINNETYVTKIAKRVLKEYYDCEEEVAVKVKDGRIVCIIDLYSKSKKKGIEIYYSNPSSYKLLKEKQKKYEKYFKTVYVALAFDSMCKRTNKNYKKIKDRLKKDKLKYYVIDVSKPYPLKNVRKKDTPTESVRFLDWSK